MKPISPSSLKKANMPKLKSKSDQTKEEIASTFLFLLNACPLNEISIKDIARTCGVNRNTFYYHFGNIADLIEYVIKNNVDNLIAKHPPKINSLEDCFIAALNFARENKQAINHIYHSTNRAIFERHLWHVCEYSVNAYLNSVPPELLPISTPEEREIVKDFLKFECFGFVIDWINHDMPENVTEKIKILSNLYHF